MIADSPTLEHVHALAQRLPRAARAELIARLAHDLAAVELGQRIVAPVDAHDARAIRAAILAAFAEQGPVSSTLAEQLEADRRARDMILRGNSAEPDVHP
jgi:hypothetical protein